MYRVFISICFMTIGNAYAQSKHLTIHDALVNNRTTLAPENLRQIQFVKGMNDYVYLMEAGINYLKTIPCADKNKMALIGWSYGGFMTTSFLLKYPGVFNAGVAGGPVMDWKYYEIMYAERYMDTPQENPAGYEATNLTKQAGKVKDKLLLIHGLQDPVVLQQHSVLFVKAAVEQRVQVDYMIYPDHEHNVLGKDWAHLNQRISNYIMQNVM